MSNGERSQALACCFTNSTIRLYKTGRLYKNSIVKNTSWGVMIHLKSFIIIINIRIMSNNCRYYKTLTMHSNPGTVFDLIRDLSLYYI